MYAITFSRPARRDLRRIPARIDTAMRAALDAIAEDPFGNHPQASALKGGRDEYRLRIGRGWRVLYRLHRDREELEVMRVLPREDAYR